MIEGKNFLHACQKPHVKSLAGYGSAVILCIVALIWIYDLANIDLHYPMTYSSDGLFVLMTIKATIENGQYMINHSLGQPYGLDLRDFPLADTLHYAIIRIIALFTKDTALVINLYYLLTFPLTALSSLFVLRSIGISYIPALAVSLLFSFAPYHLIRNQEHLTLAAYYTVPFCFFIAFHIYTGTYTSLLSRQLPLKLFSKYFIRSHLIGGLLVCIVISLSGIYYVFFSCFFILLSGLLTFLRRHDSKSLFISFVFIAVMVGSVLAQAIPTFIFQKEHGKNAIFLSRLPQETEIAGLKITQLLLPVDEHRLKYFKSIKDKYNESAPLINDNRSSSLGLIGAIGFCVLIGCFFLKNCNENLVLYSRLNICAVLYATIGGFGSLFAYLIYPQFRSLNRISIFIAFLSFIAVAYCFDKFRAGKSDICSLLMIILMIPLGIMDQSMHITADTYSHFSTSYSHDRRFFSAIEKFIPENSRVFQLPDIPFPEAPVMYNLLPYDHLKGYLHTSTLKWSYGNVKGREGDRWQRWVTSKNAPDFLDAITIAGFRGLYIDRNGYPDHAAEIEGKISVLAGPPSIISENKRYVFYDLNAYSKKLKQEKSRDERLSVPGVKKMAPEKIPETKTLLELSVDTLNKTAQFTDITGWAFKKDIDSSGSSTYIALQNPLQEYLLRCQKNKRPDIADATRDKRLENSGFSCIIAKGEVIPGVYRLGFYIKSKDVDALRFTDTLLFFD